MNNNYYFDIGHSLFDILRFSSVPSPAVAYRPKRRYRVNNAMRVLSLVVLLLGLPFSLGAAPAQQPPNILLILTDQQCADAMSCVGNARVQTPAIDSLAKQGVLFTESYCTSPVCSPSRGSFLTGLFPHQHDVIENGKRIRSDLKEICIEHLLAAKGYECVYAGKWHLGTSNTISKAELEQHPYRVIADSHDSRISDACMEYLAEEHDRPFFLVASYTNPHDICLWAMGKQKGFQRYPVPDVPLDQCPPLPANHAISKDEPTVLRDYYMARHFEYETFDDEKWRRYLHAYDWMVEAVDEEIGRLLDALRSNGLEKKTLVIFTSDHGDGVASHRWLGKCTHYEESTRVPFIVSFPGVVEPGRVDQTHLVSNGPDFYATALDYAGITIPNGCQGKSVRGLLDGTVGSDTWRDQVVSEIWVPGNNPGRGDSWKSAWGRMLRTSQFKYAVYDRGEHREQLHDLKDSRHEMKNLAADPAYADVLNEYRQRLAAWCKETSDTKFTSGSGSGETPEIGRTIDASQYFRRFPRLPAGRNTSIQKAPAPALAELSEREFGKAKITKCWLNLDEMWDYRTREFNFNYPIGVHKYDDVKEKHGETWGSVKETNVPFHDYLQAFGKHSDEVMLTIRRYERDILDGKLGVTMKDWKEIFKKAVVHYRQICPNLRYIEVCNEYALRGFIGCTAEEYYRFYQTAYQAVNEANQELGLEGDARVLVGGPAVTGDIVGKMELFFENFSKDTSPDKRLDFVSWHEYGKPYHGTALREGQVQSLLGKYGIPKAKPMFVTEHDPVHGKLGTHELNFVNGAGLVKSLYFSNVYSPGMTLMPWVQYHIREIQTQFMWFDGPNEADTRIDELRMLPSGCSMKLLSMHKDWEIAVDNGLERDELVLASVQNDGLAVHAVNYGDTRDVRIQIDKLPQVFTALHNGKLRFVKYQIDEAHSNGIADPSYSGGPQKVDEGVFTAENGSVTLTHPQLTKNGIVMWILCPETVGASLNQPVTRPSLQVSSSTQLPVFNVAEALDAARSEPQSRIERDGNGFRVFVSKSDSRPGISFPAPAGGWSLNGLRAIEAKVKNTGKHALTLHLVIDGPHADRTSRKNCRIASENISPGEEKTLTIPIVPVPPSPVEWLQDGKAKTLPYPESQEGEAYGLPTANVISIYIYHPGRECTYEVSELRAIPAAESSSKGE